jgi:hypothetical protein
MCRSLSRPASGRLALSQGTQLTLTRKGSAGNLHERHRNTYRIIVACESKAADLCIEVLTRYRSSDSTIREATVEKGTSCEQSGRPYMPTALPITSCPTDQINGSTLPLTENPGLIRENTGRPAAEAVGGRPQRVEPVGSRNGGPAAVRKLTRHLRVHRFGSRRHSRIVGGT